MIVKDVVLVCRSIFDMLGFGDVHVLLMLVKVSVRCETVFVFNAFFCSFAHPV